MKTWLYKLLTALRNRVKPPKRKMRMCVLCLAQIKRGERWHHGPTGEPMHWFCESPERGPGPIPDAEPVKMVMS